MTAVHFIDTELDRLNGIFTPRQQEAWESVLVNPFTLFGGARGGGKSWTIRTTALRLGVWWYAHMGLHNVRLGVFCEDGPTLHERQVARAVVEFPPWLGRWVMSPWPEFRFYPQHGGAVIAFRNLDEPERYRSSEFAFIGVDELTRNPLSTFNILRGSRRWPGIDRPPFLAATNPTGIGHNWVRDIWVDKTFELEETRALVEVYGEDAFSYIKATAYDNPHNSPTYIKELESLPPRLRAAFLDGNWDVFEGQAFEEWNADYHVVHRWLPPTSTWRYAMGMDWGFRQGWMGLFASNHEGDTECVWEWYFSKVYAAEAAKQMVARIKSWPRPEYIAADEQMWQDAGVEGGKTLAEEFLRGMVEAYGSLERAPRLIPAVHGRGSRAAKYDTMHQYLAWNPKATRPDGTIAPWGRPRLRFHDQCKHAIRTIKALPVDPDKPEDDVDTHAEDHAYDGVCCYLMSRPPLADRPPAKEDFQKHPGFAKSRTRRKRYEKSAIDTEQKWNEIAPPYQVPRELEPVDE